MQSRSNVRTNAVIFSILGLVVALLIHFIVLSSPEYNWLGGGEAASVVNTLSLAMANLL
jgi:light-harvesting complex 1 alpha chain